MPTSQWHKLYTAQVAAPPSTLFGLLADMPNYGRWLPGSGQFGGTTDVEPYPVRLGTRYHDGKPDQPGHDWWGADPQRRGGRAAPAAPATRALAG